MDIAVLSDDTPQTALIRQVLTAAGHACHAYADGQELLGSLQRAAPQMLILDWQTADGSAAGVTAWVRQKMPAGVPVLLLTDCAGAAAIDTGLAAGADDYQIKPLRRGELAVRVNALLRRTYRQETAPPLKFGPYAFDLQAARLARDGAAIALTRKEFELALLLFQNLGRPLSRATILDTVWRRQVDLPTRSMDTHISRVRNKLGLRPENGFRLAPVYSYGYLLEQLAA